MLTVKDLLSKKGCEAISIQPDATVYDALRLMAKHDIGALLITDGEKLQGMFSERDYARKVVLCGGNELNTLVSDVMVARIISVTPEHSVEECMKIMTEYHVRHLPVFKDEKLAGVVTIGDVVKDVMEEQRTTIHHLENYICGGYLN